MVAVSLIIFDSSTTLLSVMITESTGTVHAYETELQLGSGFRDDFQGGCGGSLVDYFYSCTTLVSVMIIESLWITESTRTVRAFGTKYQLGKRFRRQFTRRQRLRFGSRLPSQEGLCAQKKPGIR